MAKCKILWSLIKAVITVIFFYGGFICLQKSSFWHMYMDHHEIKPHHEMMVDIKCDDGLVIQSNQRSCYRRLQQVRNNHEDKCFGLRGNVTDCEILKYLIKVEHNCMDADIKVHELLHEKPQIAMKTTNWQTLYNKFSGCGQMCTFLKGRIKNNEKIWERTFDHVFHHNEVEFTDEEGTVHHKQRHRRKILIHLGLLKEVRFLSLENII